MFIDALSTNSKNINVKVVKGDQTEVVHTLNPITQEVEAEDHCQFEVNLVYLEHSRLASEIMSMYKNVQTTSYHCC